MQSYPLRSTSVRCGRDLETTPTDKAIQYQLQNDPEALQKVVLAPRAYQGQNRNLGSLVERGLDHLGSRSKHYIAGYADF